MWLCSSHCKNISDSMAEVGATVSRPLTYLYWCSCVANNSVILLFHLKLNTFIAQVSMLFSG
jgi:hypothetical protein